MAGIPTLSDLLSRFSPMLHPSPPLQSEQKPQKPAEEPQPETLLDRFVRIPTDSKAATYDYAPPLPVLKEAEPGPQEPRSGPVNLRSSFAASFSYNLSIQREVSVVASRASRPGQTRGEQADQSEASVRAAQRTAAGVYRSASEVRRFQADLSYSRTREISVNLDSAQGDRLNETGRRVSRTFELTISLDVSFLSKFSSQSKQISSLDDGNGLLNRFLDNTDGALAQSADAAQGFFDRIEGLLADAESDVVAMLDGFFTQAAEQFGLSADEASRFEEAVVSQVSDFFDEVGSFLQEARQNFTGLIPSEDPVAPALAA